MLEFSLSAAARAMNTKLLGPNYFFTGVGVDSRKIVKGELFFALKGAKVDGHHYIAEAEARGAVGVVVSREVNTKLPTLRVEDTLKALGNFAKAYRSAFQIPVIAVTGSCGKTTVREMLYSILSLKAPVLSSQGNLNTEIGVPFTLLRLSAEHRFAVIEMGARRKGDIAYLMALAMPTVGLVTNAGGAHLEIFGSERRIAEAKGEIFENLPESGIAIINQDDAYATYWRGLITPSQTIITFGLESKADIMAKNIRLESTFSECELVTNNGAISLHLSLPGKHIIQNALAAAASAQALGIALEDIKAGLERFVPVTGRLQYKTGFQGATIIDDTYNANPVSMRAALAVLAKCSTAKILVMGDMLELGKDQLLLHQQIGQEAKQLGIDKLLGLGELTAATVKAFGSGATHYGDKVSLINALKEQVNNNTTVLVKGSRSMRMEEVVLGLAPT